MRQKRVKSIEASPQVSRFRLNQREISLSNRVKTVHRRSFNINMFHTYLLPFYMGLILSAKMSEILILYEYRLHLADVFS